MRAVERRERLGTARPDVQVMATSEDPLRDGEALVAQTDEADVHGAIVSA